MKDTDQQANIEALADRVMLHISRLFTHSDIHPTEVQQKMLQSHVRAMALRSLTGEPLPEVDSELFDEISPASMSLATHIVGMFGNLPQEEAWLLSVHFEVVRDNPSL